MKLPLEGRMLAFVKEHLSNHGEAQTCAHFSLSRATLYRVLAGYDTSPGTHALVREKMKAAKKPA